MDEVSLKESEDPSLPVQLLRVSYELKNQFVEEYILQRLLNSSTDLGVWKELLVYPVSRVMEELSADDGTRSRSTMRCRGVGEEEKS